MFLFLLLEVLLRCSCACSLKFFNKGTHFKMWSISFDFGEGRNDGLVVVVREILPVNLIFVRMN